MSYLSQTGIVYFSPIGHAVLTLLKGIFTLR